jgi:hypothetical protein
MLGDKIGEMTGRVISTRVLPGEDRRYVKVEFTVEESGQLYGVRATNLGTYTVFERVPGQLYGEGQGIFQIGRGEDAIWDGHGVSKTGEHGMRTAFRFSLTVQAGPTSRLTRLNEVLVVGEHDMGESGQTTTNYWEWK